MCCWLWVAGVVCCVYVVIACVVGGVCVCVACHGVGDGVVAVVVVYNVVVIAVSVGGVDSVIGFAGGVADMRYRVGGVVVCFIGVVGVAVVGMCMIYVHERMYTVTM